MSDEKARRGRWFADAVSRGVALFLGIFSGMNAVAALAGGSNENLWWIDMRILPGWLAAAVGLAGTAALLGHAAGALSTARSRDLATAALGLLAIMAAWNVVAFYTEWARGSFSPRVPIPFSSLVIAVLLFIGWRVRRRDPAGRVDVKSVSVAVLAAGLTFIAFPLAHILFFGTTDYRAEADAIVVLGAMVYPDGELSWSAADRVETAVDVWEQGLAPEVIMSGGTGVEGVDESVAMADYAARLGVPREALTLDGQGVNTDATVANTLRIFEDSDCERVIVVSNFFHLPRIKLAYRAEGLDVRTVPAVEDRYVTQTPYLVLREVPAFWLYWGRAWAREVFPGG